MSLPFGPFSAVAFFAFFKASEFTAKFRASSLGEKNDLSRVDFLYI